MEKYTAVRPEEAAWKKSRSADRKHKREKRKRWTPRQKRELSYVYADRNTDKIERLLIYAALSGGISYLFFRSVAAWIILLPGYLYFRKEWIRRKCIREKRRIRSEFLTGIQFAGTALQSGYSMENAFQEALRELKKIYRADSFILREFSAICRGLALNETMERLLQRLADRSGVEEIGSFAQVYAIARRAGGDTSQIVRHTAAVLQQREEMQQEMETLLAGKRMEQNLMSVIPMFILGYVGLTSPGFLDPMYHNLPGILIMSGCLGIYAAAYLWGEKIMEAAG